MGNSIKLFLMVTVLLVFSFLAKTAYAYVDPGTAGLLYQVVFLIFGAIAGYFAFLRRFIKKFFGRGKSLDNKNENDQ